MGQDPSKMEYSSKMLYDLFHQSNQKILLDSITSTPFDINSLGELHRHVSFLIKRVLLDF